MQQFVIEAELFAEPKIEGRSIVQFGYILYFISIIYRYILYTKLYPVDGFSDK